MECHDKVTRSFVTSNLLLGAVQLIVWPLRAFFLRHEPVRQGGNHDGLLLADERIL
jgi:hypothetical protein